MRQSESEAPVVPKWAIQGAQTHDRDWSWVQATVWTERMLAALENGVKGNKWFSLIDKVYRPATLAAAWQRVAANKGAAGVDGQSVQHYAARAERYLGELGQALKSGTYQPLAVRRVDIPKGPGKTRPLGIPAVKDRVVQTALKWVLEPIFEREFCETSYGFRPGRGCKDALREVDRLVKAGYTHVVDADLAGYFDSIPHANLMERVAERVSDARILDLIAAYLHQEVMRGMERWTPTGGTPQGAVISPLLANLYLHPLDCLLRERGFQMVRYCDDFVVLCQSADQAQAALAEVRTWVSANGLSLNADKTQVGDCRCEGEGFEFLGYRFEAQEPGGVTRAHSGEDRSYTGKESARHHCATQSGIAWLVQLLQARQSAADLPDDRRLHAAALAGYFVRVAQTAAAWPQPVGAAALAEPLLR